MKVQRVHIVYKTHFDLGFTDSATKVLHDYINWKFDAAIALHEKLKRKGYNNIYSWTLPTYLIWEALERRKGAELRKIEKAIEDNVFVWSASPFTPNTEFMDEELFSYSLSLSKELDKRFGKETIAAKFTDVPGNTVGMLKALNKQGIKLIQVGVNWASPVPALPSEFLWKDGRGNEVIVMYSDDYGNTCHFPSSGEVLLQRFKGDNMEIPSCDEVVNFYNKTCEKYKRENPDVIVSASTYSDFARKVLHLKETLPVYIGEIGDSWIYGVASDPYKTARYRVLLRLKSEWIRSEIIKRDSKEYRAFASQLMLVAEHTWGVSHSPHLMDDINLSNEKFHAVRHRGNYQILQASWKEQRDYIEKAVEALSSNLKEQVNTEFKKIQPKEPNLVGFTPAEFSEDISFGEYTVSFDIKTGAIKKLADGKTGRMLADSTHRLGEFSYQVIPKEEVDRYGFQYWKDGEFSAIDEPKGRFNGLKSQFVLFDGLKLFCRRGTDRIEFVIKIKLSEYAVREHGGAKQIYSKVVLYKNKKYADFELSWFGKTATRLHEAYWYSFNPVVENLNNWRMDKMGMMVSPLDVVKNGSRNIHSVTSGVYCFGKEKYTKPEISLKIYDACLISPGKPNLTDYNNEKPDMSQGWGINLYNNFWQTNYTAWYDEDAMFRFRLSWE